MSAHVGSLLIICLAFVSCEQKQRPNDNVGNLLIRNVSIIDGQGAYRSGVDVLIDSQSIGAIEPTGQMRYAEDVDIVEGRGLYLVPGFIEMHAHALVPTCEQTPAGVQFSGFDWSLSEESARALLRFGITTARSPATPTDMGIAFRDSLASGYMEGPEFVVSGEFINGQATDPESVRTEIQRQAAAGVDYVKLYSQLKPEAVQAGIDEAHRLNLPVIGHLGRTSWTQGISAGIDFLTHAVPWTEEMLDPEDREIYRAARSSRGDARARIDWLELLDPYSESVRAVINTLIEHSISIDPTLVAYDTKFSYDWENQHPVAARYRENVNRTAVPGLLTVWNTCQSLTANWTVEDFRRMEAAWSSMLAIVKRYHDEGVKLTAGSDTPNHWVIPGESLHQEMELLVDAGISPMEVLTIATKNGAEALGMLQDRGTIEVGKQADLVALTANPLVDISNTRRISWVMKRGLRYIPEELN